MEYINGIAELRPFLSGADHIDVKRASSLKPLREFAAAFLGFQPGWMRFLYRVRGVLVRFLGLKQDQIPEAARLAPRDLPFEPGAAISFWTVVAAEEGRYLAIEAADRHLAATLIIAAEPRPDGTTRFHLATVVHYRNWAGPVYFNLIRPFHHLVVWAAAREAAR
ncbi:MAG: DUF2867 domain-containing protein [Pseudomonadota bacterium]